MPGHGLTPSERAVMDLWDEGCSAKQIATFLSKDLKAVNRVIGTYSIKASDRPSAFDRMAIAGSKALLAAILRHHVERPAEARP
jgi:hypothetical protein